MTSVRWTLSVCALLAVSPAVTRAAYTLAASTQFVWINSSFNSTAPGTDVTGGSLLPGSLGVGSQIDGTFANDYSGFATSGAAVQEYLVFHARASVSAHRDGPGNDFESFQTITEGTCTETLTIPAPPGVAPGSPGTMRPGWDVTGLTTVAGNASAYMTISARTSASLPNTSSFTPTIAGTGHYDLADPISFLYDTPFTITVSSSVFAGVGYDYRFTTPAPTQFAASATADFFHTATLSSVLITDAFGTPQPNATILTSSGLPFPAPVPEPALALLASPLLATRRARHPRRR